MIVQSMIRMKLASVAFAVLLFCSFWVAAQGQETLPEVRVESIRRVFHNGEHNAFTDLIRFQDRYYLTFRSCPDGHMVHPTASIIILASDDMKKWEQVHRFSVAKRDTRDPHFLIFQAKLFVYTGTWYCGDSSPEREDYELNRHLGYAAWSADGTRWQSPVMLEGTYGHYIWRAATHDGVAYLCGRRKKEFVGEGPSSRDLIESAMLQSQDGLIWRKRTLFQETQGNETAFLFEPDGSILAVGRRSKEAQVCRSKAPYTKWERSNLDRYIGGPLLTKWGDRYLVGGRRNTKEGPKTSLCWFVDGQLHEFVQLPSAGDNSYPGFIALSSTRGLVSWYSSHEKDENGQSITAIYLAELELKE